MECLEPYLKLILCIVRHRFNPVASEMLTSYRCFFFYQLAEIKMTWWGLGKYFKGCLVLLRYCENKWWDAHVSSLGFRQHRFQQKRRNINWNLSEELIQSSERDLIKQQDLHPHSSLEWSKWKCVLSEGDFIVWISSPPPRIPPASDTHKHHMD